MEVKMEKELLKDFALDKDAVSLLISLQKELINADIEKTSNPVKKNVKNKWRDNWANIVQKGLFEMRKENPVQDSPEFLFPIEVEKKLLTQRENKIQSEMLLLELVCFQPYFQLTEDNKTKSIKIDSKVRKKYLSEKAKKLGFGKDKPNQFESALTSTKNSMTNKWFKVGLVTSISVAVLAATMGTASPWIGGAVGSYFLGLSGAAAVNAGLALIGGGAIAAGGLGMGGGTAILVCGGAILGMGTGFAGAQILSSVNSVDTLLQSVKLEVALKEIIIPGDYNSLKTREILLSQRQAIDNLEEKIDKLRIDAQSEKDKIKDLEKSVEIIRNSLKRNQNIFKDAA